MAKNTKETTAEELGLERRDLDGSSLDRRTTMKLLGAAGIAAGVAGCTGGGGQVATDTETPSGGGQEQTDTDTSSDGQGGTGKYGGVLRGVWSIDQLEHLDPHYNDEPDEFQIQSNVMNAITRITEDGQIVGDLADGWEIPDATTYVFPLRRNARWHNGDEFVAEDAKWSLERLRGLDDSPHRAKLSTVDSIEVTGKYELTIHMTAPTAPFLAFMTRGPGRAGVIVHRSATTGGRVETSQEWKDYNHMPIGTGPFEITDHKRGQSLSTERFDDYWETDGEGNQLPYLDGFEIRMLPEPSTMLSSVKTGDSHLINAAPGSIWREAQNVKGLRTETALPGKFETVDFLCVKPHEYPERASYTGGYPASEVTQKWSDEELPTTDPRVRKAFTMAIDRQNLAERAWFNAAIPARQFYNPLMGWVFEEEPPEERGQHYDPERAKKLLDEAGYTPDENGVRMEITFLGETPDQRAMTVMQQYFQDIGVDVELVIKSPSAAGDEAYQYIHALYRYGGSSDIDPFMSHWNQRGSPDPTRDYVQEWAFGNWSKTLWCNEAFDMKLIEDYQTPTFEERRKHLNEAQAIHESLETGPREDDQGGPSCAMTVFPLGVKVVSESVNGITFPAALTDFHTTYFVE